MFGRHRLFGSSMEIAEAIRARVNEDLKLSCSVGIAAASCWQAGLESRQADRVCGRAACRAGIVVVLPT